MLISDDMPCNHWDGLTSFLDERRISLDTNIVERGIRPIVLECKNALFAAVTRGRRTGRARPTRGPTSPTYSPGSSISGLASRLDELMPWGVTFRSPSRKLAVRSGYGDVSFAPRSEHAMVVTPGCVTLCATGPLLKVRRK